MVKDGKLHSTLRRPSCVIFLPQSFPFFTTASGNFNMLYVLIYITELVTRDEFGRTLISSVTCAKQSMLYDFAVDAHMKICQIVLSYHTWTTSQALRKSVECTGELVDVDHVENNPRVIDRGELSEKFSWNLFRRFFFLCSKAQSDLGEL